MIPFVSGVKSLLWGKNWGKMWGVRGTGKKRPILRVCLMISAFCNDVECFSWIRRIEYYPDIE